LDHIFKDAIVIKIGGSIYNSRDSVITDIVKLQKLGQPLIIVHGGANLVTEWLNRQNHTTSFYEGERITDEASLEMVTAVLAGLVNKEIVATIIIAGGKAIGISGIDGALIQGKIKERTRGYIGAAVKVNPEPISAILSGGFVPVISPVSLNAFERLDNERALLNINGDAVAGAIARALNVKQLIFLTDVTGIYDDKNNFLPAVSTPQALELLDSGVAHGGMIPKLKACIEATSNRVTTCSIINGSIEHCILNEIKHGNTGTIIKP